MRAAAAREETGWKLTLKAAVLYDDFDFAARTAARLERAARGADQALEWEIKPWRLDFLIPSSLAEVALDEISDADLMVVALCQTHVLPDSLLEWLERWARSRRNPDTALMVLCPEEAAGPRSSWTRLQEFADWHGLPLLGQHNLRGEEDTLDFVRSRQRGGSPGLARRFRGAGRPAPGRPQAVHE